jgi:arginyl-tRNA synthetase
MSILTVLKERFRQALAGSADNLDELLDMIRRSQDATFGDYQANLAMPLGKRLGRSPRDVAAQIVAQLKVDDLCQPPEIAGPGFINLRLRDPWLADQLGEIVTDPRMGVASVEQPRTFLVDYSAPNVAKPMHVGHIRSTVIGDALYRTLQFVGHRVISDNHIGDWGTQFGMIIYGYRHFLNPEAYQQNPVQELARLYRLVRRLMDFHEGSQKLPGLREKLSYEERALAERRQAAANDKKAAKELRRVEASLADLRKEAEALEAKLARDQADPEFAPLAAAHREVGALVLAETAKLHAGDEQNRALWRQFLPACLDEIQRVYGRLYVRFDHTLGESFYEEALGPLVEELQRRGIARESNGAIVVFLEGFDVPMLIRKQDGAFLYATTDLATIRYRMDTWNPDVILYVVDHRQSLHFQQLFAAACLMGYPQDRLKMEHVSFGTVLGDDGRPFKTRSGDTVGLEGLLDEAVTRAGKIVAENDDAKPNGPELSPADRARVAETVGIAALKYADLSQNRTSDYVFSYDKMLAMNGNTATYMQYAYARVRSIFARGNIDIDALRSAAVPIVLDTPAERALAIELLRFSEALEQVLADYRPSQLTTYLFDLANRYSTFFEACPVLRAPTDALRNSRLLLCDLTARTIQKGLELLGIDVVEKM